MNTLFPVVTLPESARSARWYRGIIYRPDGADESYWRTTPVFETASEKYSWLTRIIAVGVARPVPGKAAYSVYQIL